MSKPVIFLFSGQGSQSYQMGAEIYHHDAIFRMWMDKLDEIATDLMGESVIRYVYDEKERHAVFDQLKYSHPAIFMFEYSLVQLLLERGLEPDFVIGASLGEFTSAVVAGVIDVEVALHLIIKQAAVLESYCPDGAMLAILGAPNLYHQVGLINKNSEIAAINYHSHFVVSGKKQNLEQIVLGLKRDSIPYQFLPVSKGFHSSLIESAKSVYLSYLYAEAYRPAQIPFISCVTGRSLKEIPEDYFWQVMRKPIMFRKAIVELEKRQDNNTYIDLSASGTLATFTKYNLGKQSRSCSFALCTPFGQKLNRIERIILKAGIRG